MAEGCRSGAGEQLQAVMVDDLDVPLPRIWCASNVGPAFLFEFGSWNAAGARGTLAAHVASEPLLHLLNS